MKKEKTVTCILLCIITLIFPIGGYSETMLTSSQRIGVVPYGQNEFLIGFDGIGMPLEKMLLIRKDRKYCAVTFTKFWTENDRTEKYATYEVYYQKDGTGSFLNKAVEFMDGKALFFPLTAPFRMQPGYPKIHCGSLRLGWGYKGYVAFFEGDEREDQGIELAPTIWTDIKEVDVFDPRVKWYRYDSKRQNINIPIDKLWEDEKGPEQKK